VRPIRTSRGKGQHACTCGAPGAPCPVCNAANDGNAPRIPDGFKLRSRRLAASGRKTAGPQVIDKLGEDPDFMFDGAAGGAALFRKRR
jgi:hypothetical protein